MRVHVLSDLHLERGDHDLAPPDADVIVLAGDIAVGTDGIEWAREWADGRPVLYVAGNHEFYGEALPDLTAQLRRTAQGSSVQVLENDEVLLGGVRFLGCTLWSDFDFDGVEHRELSMRVCERAVTDYRLIRHGEEDRPLRAADTRALHLASRRWLEDRLDDGHDGPTVVITHHAPYILWRPPQVAFRLLAGAFVSDLAPLMGRSAAWIYGHTHRAADRDVDGTRLVSNPRGYPDERVDGFNAEFVIPV